MTATRASDQRARTRSAAAAAQSSDEYTKRTGRSSASSAGRRSIGPSRAIGADERGGAGRHREHGRRDSIEVFVRLRRRVDRFHERSCVSRAVEQHTRHPRCDELRRLAGVQRDIMVDEHEASDGVRPELLCVDERLLHAERPGHHDGGVVAQVLEQLANVQRPTRRMVTERRLPGPAVSSRIEGDDAMRPCEMLELRLPDLGGHCPTGHEYERRTGPSVQVVKLDAVTRTKVAAARLRFSRAASGAAAHAAQRTAA